MSRYLIDTNVVLLGIRAGAPWESSRRKFGLDDSSNFLSVISLGELWSLALRNNWGAKRISEMEALIQQFIVVDINIDAIIRRYAEIDAFSQNRLKGRPLGSSARNMGKNDLWIAATASALGLTPLSTDQDFAHLSPDFVQWAQV